MSKHPIFDQTIAAVAPDLKQRGFKRSGQVWKRQHGEVAQVLVIMPSRGAVYSMVGFVFDAVRKLKPDRIGLQVLGSVTADFVTDLATLVGVRREGPVAPARILKAAVVLDRIDTAAHALDELDLDEGADKIVRAQLEWVTGKTRRALATLKATAKEFSDRKGMSYSQLAWRHLRQRLPALDHGPPSE